MTLEEYIDSLPKRKQFEIAIHLTKLALPIWDKYANSNELKYCDSVVGLQHCIDKNLLNNTIKVIEKYTSTNKINKAIIKYIDLLSFSKQFSDPIVALQDTDWELPYEVEKTFFAVSNLLNAARGKGLTVFNESTIYVTINQAIDALDSSNILSEVEIREIIYRNKNGM